MIATLALCCLANLGPQAADGDGPPLVGESERHYVLATDNQEVRGLAFDDVSPEAPRLFTLDRTGKIFVYRPHRDSGEGIDELMHIGQHLPTQDDSVRLANPRGLAFAMEDGKEIFYLLDWDDSNGTIQSHLWRCDLASGERSGVDLTWYPYRIGQREVLDLTCDHGKILICFDASGYRDNELRVARGIIQVRWNHGSGTRLEFVKHMPDSGEFTARGITSMEFEGARYLWVSAGSDYVYSAEASTGRGLFHFDRPRSGDRTGSLWGLCYGGGSLWIPEDVPGTDRVHRVNVRDNLDASQVGPRRLRHLVMTIATSPEGENADPGEVYHYYSRPYPHDQMPNQGTWPETEKLVELSGVSNSSCEHTTYDPAGDPGFRQHMALVRYGNAPARRYESRYEIDIWTGSYRKYVYPHRVNRDVEALAGTDYLADDPELFDLTDTGTYEAFHARVRAHIQRKYGATGDESTPDRVVRNALEYIQDHYYYPGREQRMPAAVDYDRHHYDANPGNLKLELSNRPYDKTQIAACSGTSVMLAGAMRFLGFEARWLGTGNEREPAVWDQNGNGLLDVGESAPVTSGHRYTQVWLGSHYGWICFDATPTRPEFMDYDPVPPIKSQWRYMNRSARGHLKDTRIVFNVGSGLFRPLYRDFEYDEKLAIDNNCGGDQRYNLQGRFEKPGLWKLARHRISVTNLCFVEAVETSGPRRQTRVNWAPRGDWHKDPGATLSLYLETVGTARRGAKVVATLASGIPYDDGEAIVDLSKHRDGTYQLVIRKDGDPETGGFSRPFNLK